MLTRADTISIMNDFRSMARDPEHSRRFEKLLYLAAQRGDADLVAERLSWGIDPNCTFSRGRTPLIANVRGSCPSTATIRALLERGADPSLMDESGLTALDYARRKLAQLQTRPSRRRPKSPSLDENDQLRLHSDEQERLRIRLRGGSNTSGQVVKDVQVIGDADTIFPAINNRTARDMAFRVAVLGEDSGDLPLIGS
jgi:hypothetical protein